MFIWIGVGINSVVDVHEPSIKMINDVGVMKWMV